MKKIGMETAWGITTGSTNVVVAIIDTGVDYTHPDLAANMWRNPGETGLDENGHDKATNGIDDDGNGYVDDVFGVNTITGSGDPMDYGYRASDGSIFYHGTADAGTVAAVGNNGLGIAGINWNVRVMAIAHQNLLVSASLGSFISHTIAAFDYVLEMKRRGVNIQVIDADIGNSDIVSQAMVDAIQSAARQDLLIVWSADNHGFNLDVSYFMWNTIDSPNLIVVAATEQNDTLRSDSDYGRSIVHLAAPGGTMPCLDKNGKYTTWQRTSAATPHVAGVAALLCAAKTEITVDEMKAALYGSVDPLTSLKGKVRTNGRLNAARALQSLTNSPQPAIVIYSAPHSLRTDPSAPIEVTFNRPMDHASVEAAFQLKPALNGSFEWTPDNRTFLFRHNDPFQPTNYTAMIAGNARDAEGGSLDGNFDRLLQASPADDYIWTFDFALPNDDLANALPIEGATGSVDGNNFRATFEFGQPDDIAGAFPAASLWYRWRAPGNGWFTFDTTQKKPLDTLLAIYRGATLSDLSEIASNTDYGSIKQSRVSFRAEEGANYMVLLAGNPDSSESANFTLTWYPTPPPRITSFTPTEGVPGQVVTITGVNLAGVTSIIFGDGPRIALFDHSINAALQDLQLFATIPSRVVALPNGQTLDREVPITVEAPYGTFTTTSLFKVYPAPTLQIELDASGQILLTWPQPPSGFVVQGADHLSANADWVNLSLPAVPPPPGMIRFADSPAATRFYRLRHP